MQGNSEKDSIIIGLLQHDGTANDGMKKLIDAYGSRLYKLVHGMVGNHEDTDDILQNVLVKVYRHIRSFRQDARLYSWLFRIATNETLSFLKSQKKHLNAVPQDLHVTHFDEQDALRKLGQALESLPVKQRLVFNLRYFEQMSYKDIALMTGTSEGALKASYHHAVKKLENYLRANNIH